MKKSNSKFASFLDEKFIPMAPKIKIAITVVLIILPVVIFYFAWYQPKMKTTESLKNSQAKLERQIKQVKRKAGNLKKFEKELQDAELAFNETAELLPKEKEIPQLLKDISSLGRNAGLDFLSFKPQSEVPKDFYSELPASINVRGPYHNMGFFLDQVSKLKRIVSVSNIRMTSPKKEGTEMFLTSTCRLVTYQFTNRALPKKEKK